MAYHMDDAGFTLVDLRRRIEATDLVPSRACLLDGLESTMSALGAQGIVTLAQLRAALKTAKRLDATARSAGIDKQHLTLLRREIESYFPKPPALRAFDWLPESEIVKLESCGVHDAAALHATAAPLARAGLLESTGVDAAVLDSLVQLADLTRVQWVSPATARWLVEADCESASKLAASDPEELCAALWRVNCDGRFFKGSIGLRDVRRLVQSAGYVAG